MEKTAQFQKSAYLSDTGCLDLFISDSQDLESLHWHSDYEVLMPLSGKYSIVLGNACYTISKHDIVLIPLGSLHFLKPEQKDSFCLHIRLPKATILSSISHSYLLARQYPGIVFWNELDYSIQQHMVTTLHSIYQETERGSSLTHTPISKLFQSFLSDVSTYLSAEYIFPSSRNHPSRYYETLFDNTCHFLTTHCIDYKDFEDLRPFVEFHSNYFLSLFKSCLGLSINEFVLQEKLLKSVYYLADSSLSIDEISSRSGFQNGRTFHRRFQNFFHCTPTQYQKKYLQF